MSTFEWYTPPEIIKPLGEFDLDPCFPVNPIYQTAKRTFNIYDNGLIQPWEGRVWLNPPYGNVIIEWMKRMANHNNGIALIFARTETEFFQDYVLDVASSIFFLRGRLFFLDQDGSPKKDTPAPSVLVAYNESNSESLHECGLPGHHQYLQDHLILVDYQKTWKMILRSVVTNEATLEEIYRKVEEAAPKRVRANKHHKAKIRQTLQMFFKRKGKGVYAPQTILEL